MYVISVTLPRHARSSCPNSSPDDIDAICLLPQSYFLLEYEMKINVSSNPPLGFVTTFDGPQVCAPPDVVTLHYPSKDAPYDQLTE